MSLTNIQVLSFDLVQHDCSYVFDCELPVLVDVHMLEAPLEMLLAEWLVGVLQLHYFLSPVSQIVLAERLFRSVSPSHAVED